MVCVDIGQTASRSLIVYHQGPATNRSNTPSITEQLGTLHNYWTVRNSPQLLNSWGLSKITEQLGNSTITEQWRTLQNYWTVGDTPQLLNSGGLSKITEQLGTLHNYWRIGTLHNFQLLGTLPSVSSHQQEQYALNYWTVGNSPQLLNSGGLSKITEQLGTLHNFWTVGDSRFSVQPPTGALSP